MTNEVREKSISIARAGVLLALAGGWFDADLCPKTF